MPTRANVLFVSADLPWPPDGGGRIASLRVLEAFARNYTVDLLALTDPARTVDVTHLRQLCRQVDTIPQPFTFGLHPRAQAGVALRSLLSRDPYRFVKFRSAALAAALAARVSADEYDHVHHEQLGVAQYRCGALPSTVATQNVEADIYATASRTGHPISRIWSTIESAKLRRREATVLAGFDEVFVLSDDDAQSLGRASVERVTVLPIPAPNARPARPAPAPPQLLTLGSMSWFGVADGLRWFHREVWPIVKARAPTATWVLVGSGAPRDIRRWADEPGIELAGHLDSVEATLMATRVAIIPLRIAGGIRVKLLELLAAGVPVVATERAARGILPPDGAGCFLRDDPGSFADAIVALLREDALWLRTAEAGRVYLESRHRPEDLDRAIVEGVERAGRHHSHGVSAR